MLVPVGGARQIGRNDLVRVAFDERRINPLPAQIDTANAGRHRLARRHLGNLPIANDNGAGLDFRPGATMILARPEHRHRACSDEALCGRCVGGPCRPGKLQPD